MSLIASSIPGRLRLRDRALRDPARLESLRVVVARWRNVHAVEANPKAGSLLIHYDADKVERPAVEKHALAAVEKVLGTSAGKSVKVGADEAPKLQDDLPAVAAGKTATHAHPHGGTPRVKANRWAKRAMLASLAISLPLAGAGRKRWHALTGVLFLHALAVHLWVHRRHVLR